MPFPAKQSLVCSYITGSHRRFWLRSKTWDFFKNILPNGCCSLGAVRAFQWNHSCVCVHLRKVCLVRLERLGCHYYHSVAGRFFQVQKSLLARGTGYLCYCRWAKPRWAPLAKTLMATYFKFNLLPPDATLWKQIAHDHQTLWLGLCEIREFLSPLVFANIGLSTYFICLQVIHV